MHTDLKTDMRTRHDHVPAGAFTGLWMLLFIIPGIVKSYEYMMIPYLLAEHPEMTRQEAFAESKQMMDGNKWDAICVRSFIYRLDAVRCSAHLVFFLFFM